jgi:hypothetical protein
MHHKGFIGKTIINESNVKNIGMSSFGTIFWWTSQLDLQFHVIKHIEQLQDQRAGCRYLTCNEKKLVLIVLIPTNSGP